MALFENIYQLIRPLKVVYIVGVLVEAHKISLDVVLMELKNPLLIQEKIQ